MIMDFDLEDVKHMLKPGESLTIKVSPPSVRALKLRWSISDTSVPETLLHIDVAAEIFDMIDCPFFARISLFCRAFTLLRLKLCSQTAVSFMGHTNKALGLT